MITTVGTKMKALSENRLFLPSLLTLALLTGFLPRYIRAQPRPRFPVGEIVNPSAELTDSNQRPLHWTIEPRPPAALTPAVLDSATAHHGSRSLLLTAGNFSWSNKVLVRPYATYRLSGWIKTEAVPAAAGWGARFELRGVNVPSPPRPITGTADWTKVEIVFDTDGQDSFILAATLGRSRAPRSAQPAEPPPALGKAWFDDLRLELLSARELKPSVVIDAAKTREPMPDLIYGQFIEHLGRCIYGGIWAEMLEDRKFYSAVGETRRGGNFVPSPWRAVGEPSAVMMRKENAFVGEHSPEVSLRGDGSPAGIAQSGLGLVAGKGYVGYVILAGDASAAPIEVSLIWGSGPRDRQTVRLSKLTSEFRKFPLRFKAGASTDNATLEIVSRGRGRFRIGTASLMPDDNIRGMRRDTLALLRQLNAPIYRWPGGNFVSGYNWKDGIGDRDRRPPRKNPAWAGIESNDFGLHEFFELCRELKAEPFIALNTGLGSVELAAEQVEYVNGGPETPMGRLRASNGHREPFRCRYWAVGNEMSGDWQLGHVPIEEFVKRHNAFAQAVLKVDPSIVLVASGEAVRPSSDWDRKLLAHSAEYIHLNSKHFYRQDWHGGGLMTHVLQIGDAIRAIAEAHREYLRTIPEIRGKNIRVALDEWNYWYGPHVFGELGTRYFLRDALGIAAGINEYSRQTDVIALACYAQTVNVIGAIKTSKTAAVLDSTGMALVMYRRHFGTIPVQVTGSAEPLDVAVAWSRDRKALTISVINPTYEPQQLSFTLSGATLAPQGKSWVLTAADDFAFNEPGKPPAVQFTEQPVHGITNSLFVAPASATIFWIPVK
jgi:alpha-N-arabinofuranosidase